MAAKIGILGESTVVTNTTLTTVYTVPADKAARIRVLFLAELSSSVCKYSLLIGSPGTEITVKSSANGNIDIWSGVLPLNTPDPALGIRMNDSGIMQLNGGLSLTDYDASLDYIGAPMAADYFLSTGDTVKFHIQGGDLTDHLIQVHGVEDDA